MNKAALKRFATSARRELLKKVEARAMKIGITEDNIKKAEIESSDAIFIDGRQLSKEEKIQRDRLISRINEIGFNRVMEEVAYTWFNRFTALRFMEVNDYLPTKVRVLSSSNSDSSEPDMMKEAMSLDLDIDKEYVYELKMNNKSEELFKYLIIKHCNDLNRYMPFMFEKINDYTEILFPEGLLTTDSFVRRMTNTEEIPEDNWEKIEVIGWLYQFYIAEEKDRVFREKKKYKAEEIPYATQLFTPDWIVRYMVQNALGRYWVEAHPEHKDLTYDWEFYIEHEEGFEEKIAPYVNKELKVEDIKCLDPAMGSGHILVYMFDILYEIYIKCGYMEREIPRLIIEKNLYGLDIDDRAYQLACFSVVMKAMEYNRRFLRSIERDGLTLNLASIQETNSMTDDDIDFIIGESNGEGFNAIKSFVDQYKDAKTFGSLIKVNDTGANYLEKRLKEIETTPINDMFQIQRREKVFSICAQLIKQTEIMKQQYDVVILNPPYMGSGNMNRELSNFLKKNYPDSKSDLFAAFMEIDHFLQKNGFYAAINQHSWMFLSSYERLRKKIIKDKFINTMLHLGPRAFEEISGEVVQSTAFVFRNAFIPNTNGTYVRLIEEKTSKEKKEKAIEVIRNSDETFVFKPNQSQFKEIPGNPIAYWANKTHYEAYKKANLLKEVAEIRKGLASGNTDKFIKYWFEVLYKNISFEGKEATSKRWYPCHKGGGFRKWYGNMEKVINWENDGYEIKNYKDSSGKLKSRPQNLEYMLKKGIIFSKITSSGSSCRLMTGKELFDDAVQGIFAKKDKVIVEYLLAVLNSPIIAEFLKILNPTLNKQIYDLERIPIIISENYAEVIDLSIKAIEISRNEWDERETSWNFSSNPLISMDRKQKTLREEIEKLSEKKKNRNKVLFEIEKNINTILFETYKLRKDNGEDLNSNYLEQEIQAENKKEIVVELVSYFLGCSFGRYSLDEEGLIYAGGKFDPTRYKTFPADKDNILPILPGSYFEDDIVSRFIDFVRITFGEETLDENLDFVADALGRKKGETAKETLRRYFLNDFYKDHVKTYKKRPIYWLFTSGKEKAFNCLIYMHRYDKTTLSRIRTDYLHEYQNRLDAEKENLLDIINGNDSTAKEISNAKKELKSLEKKIDELKAYDELLHHMADMQIEIDLDDGVKVNYEKFKGLVAKI